MLFVLDWCFKVNCWPCYFSQWFIGQQVTCANVQDKMIRTAPYWWFYVIVHTCCFFTWKGFNKYCFTIGLGFAICVQVFGHFLSIKVFYHTVSYDKYRFFVLFSIWFIIFVITCSNCFLWVLTTIQSSYDCHVLVDLLRYIFLLFILLAVFLFISEASRSVFILAFLAVDGFCVL